MLLSFHLFLSAAKQMYKSSMPVGWVSFECSTILTHGLSHFPIWTKRGRYLYLVEKETFGHILNLILFS